MDLLMLKDFGPFWPILGRFRAFLEDFGPFWPILERFRAFKASIWAFLAYFWEVLGL